MLIRRKVIIISASPEFVGNVRKISKHLNFRTYPEPREEEYLVRVLKDCCSAHGDRAKELAKGRFQDILADQTKKRTDVLFVVDNHMPFKLTGVKLYQNLFTDKSAPTFFVADENPEKEEFDFLLGNENNRLFVKERPGLPYKENEKLLETLSFGIKSRI